MNHTGNVLHTIINNLNVGHCLVEHAVLITTAWSLCLTGANHPASHTDKKKQQNTMQSWRSCIKLAGKKADYIRHFIVPLGECCFLFSSALNRK